MAKLLLVGNGVNRLADGPSWVDVVATLASHANLGPEFSSEGKPLPLVYEHIVCRRGLDEFSAKQDLARSMQRLTPNWSHERALAIAGPHLLTTNYDYCFERSSRQRQVRQNLRRESAYSAFRRNRVGDKFVWHIHGELDAPRTMLLGLHHYSGYIQRLRGYLTAERSESSFQATRGDFEGAGEPYSWVDLFLRDDVHVVGLTMDYVEMHLWWLIAYKLRLAAKKAADVGATHFYHIHDDTEGRDVATRLQMLRDLSVEVHRIAVLGRDWDAAYKAAFEQIETA